EAQDCFKRVNDVAGLGQVSLAQGNYSAAKKIFSQTEEYSGIALTYLADNDFENAEKYFIKAGDYFGLGLTFFAKGDFDSAKKIFSSSHNKTVQGIVFLMENHLESAKRIFEKLKDHNLLAASYRALGDLDKALEIYTTNNNMKQAARVLLEDGKLQMAYELFMKNEDELGVADLYYRLGDYERAYEHYDKNHAYSRAFMSLMGLGNMQRALRYGDQILNKYPDQTDIEWLMVETLRLTREYRKAEERIKRLRSLSFYKNKLNILESRLDLSREKPNTLTRLLQEAVNESGLSFLTAEIIKGARARGLTLISPTAKSVDILTKQKTPYTIIKLILGIFAGSWVLFWLVLYYKKQRSKPPELEDLHLSYGEVSESHKNIYQDRTALRLSTLSKLKGKSEQETTPATKKTTPARLRTPTPATPSPSLGASLVGTESGHVTPAGTPQGEGGLKKLEDKMICMGFQVLQIALMKLGITSSAIELIELSGEDFNRLTVYGIYLAARAKGAQVQGIKVDFSYLLEPTKGIHLVFFNDESFAMLNSISGVEIELTHGLNQVKKISREEFMINWNGYIITLTKI
ncbi:MAG: hypothetical protein JW774_01285, partial [Candidatus Aureabacteria bacterium]|nr:hypothetical protein [Candidatus Auribacterota bacterium]